MVWNPTLARAAHNVTALMLTRTISLGISLRTLVIAAYFTSLITWTTYGTWLPGDSRGWRKRGRGPKVPQPLLEDWCRRQMQDEAVLLRPADRNTVEAAIREHCEVRGWQLFAVTARSNHIHVVVRAAAIPRTVRDQLKANCTRRLRSQSTPLIVDRTWTRGGDCEILDTEEDIEAAVIYITEAQERKDRDAQL